MFTLDSYPVRNFISMDLFITPSLSPTAAERMTCNHKQVVNVTVTFVSHFT